MHVKDVFYQWAILYPLPLIFFKSALVIWMKHHKYDRKWKELLHIPQCACHKHCCALTGLLTRWAYSTTATVLSLKMFFIAYRTHAICTRVSIKSAASGAKHRCLAVVSFLSHVLLLHTWNLQRINKELNHRTSALHYPNLLFIMRGKPHMCPFPEHSMAVPRNSAKVKNKGHLVTPTSSYPM